MGNVEIVKKDQNCANDNSEIKSTITYENKKYLAIKAITKKRKNYSKYVKKCQKTKNCKDICRILDKNDAFDNETKSMVLTEYETVKIWMKTLMSIYGSIPNIIKIIDQIIFNQAKNPFCGPGLGASTDDQIEKVIDFCDRKNKLLNINILIEKLFESLTPDERELIELKFTDRVTMDAISARYGIDRRSCYRKLDRIIIKLANYALNKGWSSMFIASQLINEPWVCEQYNTFVDEFNKRKKTVKLDCLQEY